MLKFLERRNVPPLLFADLHLQDLSVVIQCIGNHESKRNRTRAFEFCLAAVARYVNQSMTTMIQRRFHKVRMMGEGRLSWRKDCISE